MSPAFFQLILIWNLGLSVRVRIFFLILSSDDISFQHSQCFLYKFVCRSFFLLRSCPLRQSAFVFIIEYALDWFMARPTNLKYESSFGFRWFVYSPLFFHSRYYQYLSGLLLKRGFQRPIFPPFVLQTGDFLFSLRVYRFGFVFITFSRENLRKWISLSEFFLH